jgi:hypothetical protein
MVYALLRDYKRLKTDGNCLVLSIPHDVRETKVVVEEEVVEVKVKS